MKLHAELVVVTSCALVALSSFELGLDVGQSDSRDSKEELEIVLAQKILAQDELQREEQGCDRIFSWYERCLDGRTCTDALPPLELHREFELPALPHMRPPWEKSRGAE